MPNGQLVEWYIPLKELEEAKKAGNHALFDKWRNKTEEEKRLEWESYITDATTSRERYFSAFQAAIARLGLSETAAEASWKKVEAEVVSVIQSKLSLRSSAEGMERVQEPSFNTTENFLQATQTRPFPGSRDTKAFSIGFSNSRISDQETLFQTDSDLLDDAHSFISWNEFVKYYESFGAPDDYNVSDLSPEELATWCRDTWECAKKTQDNDPSDAITTDADFLDMIWVPGGVEAFMDAALVTMG